MEELNYIIDFNRNLFLSKQISLEFIILLRKSQKILIYKNLQALNWLRLVLKIYFILFYYFGLFEVDSFFC